MDGGYDKGYKACKCFWGKTKGTLIKILDTFVDDYKGLIVFDAGCGDGRNAAYLSSRGAKIRAIDISDIAITNAKENWTDRGEILWEIGDVREMKFAEKEFDIVITSGFFHCFANPAEVYASVNKLKNSLKVGGFFAVSNFNGRHQELHAQPGFTPSCLMSHDDYVKMFDGWNLLHVSDTDLTEAHPHNNISHTHSVTRIIARK